MNFWNCYIRGFFWKATSWNRTYLPADFLCAYIGVLVPKSQRFFFNLSRGNRFKYRKQALFLCMQIFRDTRNVQGCAKCHWKGNCKYFWANVTEFLSHIYTSEAHLSSIPISVPLKWIFWKAGISRKKSCLTVNGSTGPYLSRKYSQLAFQDTPSKPVSFMASEKSP